MTTEQELQRRLHDAHESADKLRNRISELEKDKARLDWCENGFALSVGNICFTHNATDIRSAIDAAMKEDE